MHKKALVRDLLKEKQTELTAAERKLSAVLLDDSLLTGLQSINRLAECAEVSSPTIIRLARKLGFDGFSDMQDAIREEIGARMKQPLAKLDAAPPSDSRDHIVSRFIEAVSDNINRTLDRLDLTAVRPGGRTAVRPCASPVFVGRAHHAVQRALLFQPPANHPPPSDIAGFVAKRLAAVLAGYGCRCGLGDL